MQLRTARMCLDCEEVHDKPECPVCLSEAFVYITRWIPVEERRARRLPSATKVAPEVEPERSGASPWLRRGVLGLALVAASRWWWEAGRKRPPAQEQ